MRNGLFQLLLKSVEHNDVASLESILRQEEWLVNRLFFKEQNLLSYLYVAAENGFVEVANLLIDANANVNQQCANGNTPLHIASIHGHDEMVRFLLQQPTIVVDLSDDQRRTALDLANQCGRTSVVQLLSQAGATHSDVDDRTVEDRTATLQKLTLHIHKKDLESVQAILRQEKWLVNRLVSEKLVSAPYYGTGARYNDVHHSLLYAAAGFGHVDIARALICANANVNQQCAQGNTPLGAAAGAGHSQMVQLLLAQPDIVVDLVNDSGASPLQQALPKRRLSVVQLLLYAKANANHVNYAGTSCLQDSRCSETAWLLLQHKADVNHQDRHGFSSLHHAAQCRDDASVAALLDANAIVDVTCASGDTPLHVAADGSGSTLQLLVAAGADVHRRNGNGETALLIASSSWNEQGVRVLLNAGADPNVANAQGLTAICSAALKGITHCVRELLKAKADINQADPDGDTPVILAVVGSHGDTASFLLEQGADLVNGKRSARRCALRGSRRMALLFSCALCGQDAMCCSACRKQYCLLACDKRCGICSAKKIIVHASGRRPTHERSTGLSVASNSCTSSHCGVDAGDGFVESASVRTGTYFQRVALAHKRPRVSKTTSSPVFSHPNNGMRQPQQNQLTVCAFDYCRIIARGKHSLVH